MPNVPRTPTRARRRRPGAIVALVALAAACVTALPGSAGATGGGPSVQVIASGLNLSWGIDRGPWPGSVLVAESGSGNVLKVWDGGQWTVGSPGPSVTDVALGWWDVSYVIGLTEDGGPSNLLGRVQWDGTVTVDADLGAYEAANNPDQNQVYGIVDPPANCPVPEEFAAYTGIVDSNLYSVEVIANGWRLVADAAGNDILLVDDQGNISVIAVLPPVPKTIPAEILGDEGPIPVPECLQGVTYLAEPVPTSVVKGPDGWLYVSGLTGQPELPGTGVVFRVDPWTGESTVWQDGLTTAGDLTIDRKGRVYVTEVFGGTGPASETPGALVRINTTWGANGLEPTGVETIATGADGVVTPLGVTTDEHGNVYVSVKSLPLGPPGEGPPPATGEILKFSGL